jgi:hypothetical protein
MKRMIKCNDAHWLSRLPFAIRRRKCPTIQQNNKWTQKWPCEKDALARDWLDTFSCVLRTADVTINEVNHIRCFAIAKYLILLSCHLAIEHLCLLQLEKSYKCTKITSGRHKQKGLNLLFFNFLTSALSLTSW